MYSQKAVILEEFITKNRYYLNWQNNPISSSNGVSYYFGKNINIDIAAAARRL